MTTKTNTTKKNTTIGCDNLIDGAFTPEAGQNRRASKQSNALREEAGFTPALSLSDLFDSNFTVQKKRAGTPEVGLHVVTIDGEPEVRKGRDGAYIVVDLVDRTGLCWKAFVNAADLKAMLEDISFYNNGMLAGKGGMEAFNFLMKHEFNCWVLKTEKGNVATYYNEERYNKRMYAMSLNEAKKEERELKNKERADNEARMAEEAKMGREDKAPWEE